jgi:hypothetical protein
LTQEPIAEKPNRRKPAFWLLGCLAVLLLLLAFAWRPAPILGMDGKALQGSVGGSLFGPEIGSCRHLQNGEWMCQHYDDQFSGTIGYRVSVDSVGCWQGDRVGPPGEGSRKHLSGCVTLLSYLFS